MLAVPALLLADISQRMTGYPSLSTIEQNSLPELVSQPFVIPAKFEDSTHQLWQCETVDGPMVLKVCREDSLKQSSFWQGLNQLFDLDFPAQLGQSSLTAQYLNQHGHLFVPDVMAAQNNHFVLTRYVAGKDLHTDQVTNAHVVKLAQHIGRLHQQRFNTWGKLHAPHLASALWGERLHQTIFDLADQQSIEIPTQYLNEICTLARNTNERDFVPIMPDLRWDQLRLLEDDKTIALIDLDAFVVGPRTLELVLLEYLLTPEQFILFRSVYLTLNDWPDYQLQKPCYQLLLFLMNVLGETDLTAWMQQV